MISRTTLARSARHASSQCPSLRSHDRGLASAASGTFAYQTGNAAGVKIATRDIPGPTAHLAVVAKAGTRYELLPGFSDALEKFAFKNTERRSALRMVRETELLGGELSAYHSRENLVLSTKFLKDDLPYFAELLGEVISRTVFTAHELNEEVTDRLEWARKDLLGSSSQFANNSVHGVAFHRGLGNSLHPQSHLPIQKYINPQYLRAYSKGAYAKTNIAVVANGANHDDLSKWVSEFFTGLFETSPEGLPESGLKPSKYYGGEERIAFDSGNTMVIAFPGSGSFTGGAWKPEISILASLLGGQSNIKWSPGFSILSKATQAYPQTKISTVHNTYSDAGLLTVEITGVDRQVREASFSVVKALKSVAAGNISKEDITKAIAAAKFKVLESGQNIDSGIELTGAGLVQGGGAFQLDEVAKSLEKVTEESVKKAAKTLLDGKASVSSVGDLYVLPFAEEIGLNV